MPIPITELGSKFVIGCGGALVTIYSKIGGELPGMGKSYEIDDRKIKITEIEKKINQYDKEIEDARKEFNSKNKSVEEFNALQNSYSEHRSAFCKELETLRASVTELSNRFNTRGTFFFLLLGGFFAAFLTTGTVFEGDALNIQTVLAAVAMGAGWTGIVAKLGDVISKDELTEYRTQLTEKLEENYSKLLKHETELKERAIKGALDFKKMTDERISNYEKSIETFTKDVNNYEKFIDEVESTLTTMKDKGIFTDEHLSVLKDLGLLGE